MVKKNTEKRHGLKNGDILHVIEEGGKAKIVFVEKNGSFARKLSSVTIAVFESALAKGKLLIDGLTLCFEKKKKKVPK